MADHKAEQIMTAVKTALTGLTSTGANVARGRAYAFVEDELPALSVFMGADSLEGGAMFNRTYSVLTFHVIAHALSSVSQLETVLNQIRKEVTVALMTYSGNPLGLAFCTDMDELGADQPEILGDGDKPAATLKMNFQVRYMRTYADPSL